MPSLPDGLGRSYFTQRAYSPAFYSHYKIGCVLDPLGVMDIHTRRGGYIYPMDYIWRVRSPRRDGYTHGEIYMAR